MENVTKIWKAGFVSVDALDLLNVSRGEKVFKY